MILLALKLLIAHILGDFVFQPNKWVKDKQKKKLRSNYLYYHIGLHALFLLIILKFDFSYWIGITTIVLSHGIIDVAKLYVETKKNTRILFLLDQLLHLAVILIVTASYSNFQWNTQALYSPKALLLLFSVLNITFVSSVILKIIMGKWQIEENNDDKSLTQAGKYIGILERLFVFCFVILHQWGAIGFLITAKSVFRFGDLSKSKDRKLTEYVLIGTLLSFALAISTGLLYLWGMKFM